MTKRRLEDLSDTHRSALRWFADNAGRELQWAPEIPGGPRLFSTPKGIYKPEGSLYALSIRRTLASRYPDSEPVARSDGTWSFTYHQEGDSLAKRDSYFTNRGLLQCMRDGVPVGVALQTRPKPHVRYMILGLAQVVAWRDGLFYLEGFSASGLVHGIQPDGVHSSSIDDIGLNLQVRDAYEPESIADARSRVLTSIVRRRGQATFRTLLLAIYDWECAVSGCNAEAALEAAHVTPYLGPLTNSPQNGLLLRADLHTLWDLGLWAICEDSGKIVVAPQLRASCYEELAGKVARLPRSGEHRPSAAALAQHRREAGI